LAPEPCWPLDDKALPIEADQERIWTLLSVAYGHEVPLAVLGSLRRVAKHWHSGDESLAAIHLAQTGLPDIGEDAAYRLSLAAELIGAGVAPRELARELGFSPAAGLLKYNPDQPRVPAGSGRESAQWTSSGDAAGPALTEGRSAEVSLIGGGRRGSIAFPNSRGCDRCYTARGKNLCSPQRRDYVS
jgi:hypothetical protein